MYNISGAIGFSSKRSMILIPCSFRPNESFFKYEFHPIPPRDPEREIVWSPQFDSKGEIEAESNELLSINAQDKSKAPLVMIDTVHNANKDALTRGVIILELPFDKAVPGEYNLVLRNVSSKDSTSIRVRIEWENMPLSLRKPEYAVEMLYYILKDEQYKEIKSGSPNEIFNKIVKFWNASDPTPGTLYNEAMNQYYQRVDYASINYNTFSEKDGAKTDRGKVYILNSAPSSVNQSIDGRKKIESWDYTLLNKRFVFELNPDGIYKLIREEAINKK
jgi:GWxTD domain-containing protein